MTDLKPTHTPGPTCSCSCELVGSHSNEQHEITFCPMHEAAPELLAALIGLLELGRKDTSNPKYDGFYEVAQAAIQKAESR